MTVGIVGMGYVGLPLAVAFAESGHRVIAMDSDPHKVAALEASESYIEDIPSAALLAVSDRIEATTRVGPLAQADAVLICVPTPLTANREPDLGPLLDATSSLARILRAGQLVVLESTTYPGTTRERLVPLLEESGLAAGADFSLAFSPERVDPGNETHTIRNTPKVVGGLTEVCTQRATDLYSAICDEIVPVSTPEAAELTKLLENIFRSVNIALVNELALLADRMGIDVWEVVDAAGTKPFGFMRFEPGPGMGGHCLPIDPFYLAFKAREHDFYTEFVELAGKLNQAQPHFCVEKIERTLNDASKPVRGSRVLLLGVAYKGGVGDMRESPALKIIHELRRLGAEVSYHDPHIAQIPELGLASADLDAELAAADIAIIVTAHPEVDHDSVVREAPLVLDFRGVTRGMTAENLVRLSRPGSLAPSGTR